MYHQYEWGSSPVRMWVIANKISSLAWVITDVWVITDLMCGSSLFCVGIPDVWVITNSLGHH